MTEKAKEISKEIRMIGRRLVATSELLEEVNPSDLLAYRILMANLSQEMDSIINVTVNIKNTVDEIKKGGTHQ